MPGRALAGRQSRRERLESDSNRRGESGRWASSTASLLPIREALVVRNVSEALYLRPCYALKMLAHVTTPNRPTGGAVGEAVLFGELPGRNGLAGAGEDIGVGGERCYS